jgi:NIPSNAP protein
MAARSLDHLKISMTSQSMRAAGPIRSASAAKRNKMLYEIRTYTFKPLRGADWLALYQSEGLPLQQEFLGDLIGFFTTEIGDISQIVHIWAYKSLDDRLERRDRMAADSRWLQFGRKVKALDIFLSMESRIMRPTDFSPLK